MNVAALRKVLADLDGETIVWLTDSDAGGQTASGLRTAELFAAGESGLPLLLLKGGGRHRTVQASPATS